MLVQNSWVIPAENDATAHSFGLLTVTTYWLRKLPKHRTSLDLPKGRVDDGVAIPQYAYVQGAGAGDDDGEAGVIDYHQTVCESIGMLNF